ncbi:unnamed protein product [Fusarium graminearum]|nr:unnamed protein product [Fusarium graminearum]
MRSLRPSRPVFPGPEWTDKFSAPDSAIVALSFEYPDNFEDEVAHKGKVKFYPTEPLPALSSAKTFYFVASFDQSHRRSRPIHKQTL